MEDYLAKINIYIFFVTLRRFFNPIFMKYILLLLIQIGIFSHIVAQDPNGLFSGVPFERVVAYRMYGKDMYSIVEKDNTLYEKGVDISSGVVLNPTQVHTLLAFINDTTSYGGGLARCFIPHEGLVFYDPKGKIVAHLTICFECNYLRASPSIPILESSKISPGFSRSQKYLLQSLMKEILANPKKAKD